MLRPVFRLSCLIDIIVQVMFSYNLSIWLYAPSNTPILNDLIALFLLIEMSLFALLIVVFYLLLYSYCRYTVVTKLRH